jgi:hypothetical protein
MLDTSTHRKGISVVARHRRDGALVEEERVWWLLELIRDAVLPRVLFTEREGS